MFKRTARKRKNAQLRSQEIQPDSLVQFSMVASDGDRHFPSVSNGIEHNQTGYPIASNGIQWYPIGDPTEESTVVSGGIRWCSTGPVLFFNWTQRDPTRSNGVQRGPTGSNGIQRDPTGSNGIQRDLTGSNGIQRNPTGSNGIQRDLLVSNGIQVNPKRDPVVSDGIQRVSPTASA